jgi:hypothetical protein
MGYSQFKRKGNSSKPTSIKTACALWHEFYVVVTVSRVEAVMPKMVFTMEYGC